MVRGCQKRIIFLRSTDSKLFDEAYFVLSERAFSPVSKVDMIAEANRILSDNLLERSGGAPILAPKKRLSPILLFMLGAAVGFAAGFLLFFLK